MNTNVKAEIGNRIREIRKDMNMRQCEFAALCGMSKQMLCYIEQGKNSVTIESLINICNATGESADYIVFNKANDCDPPYNRRLQNKLSKYSEEEFKNALGIINDVTSATC